MTNWKSVKLRLGKLSTSGLAVPLFALVGCVGGGSLQAQESMEATETPTEEVYVLYDASNCPTEVSNYAIVATEGVSKIRWQSAEKAEDGTYSPISTGFDVYFSPFQGDQIPGSGGKTNVKVVKDVPVALYKYTVVGRDCPDKPLDPFLRVY